MDIGHFLFNRTNISWLVVYFGLTQIVFKERVLIEKKYLKITSWIKRKSHKIANTLKAHSDLQHWRARRRSERERKEAKCTGKGRGSPEKIYLLLIIDFASFAILTRVNLVWCSDGQEIAILSDSRNGKRRMELEMEQRHLKEPGQRDLHCRSEQ